jgi:hypothetical protein
VTSLPRPAARTHAPPPPHPASRNRTPAFTPSAESVSCQSGRQNGSCNSAQSRGAALHSWPCRSPDAIAMRMFHNLRAGRQPGSCHGNCCHASPSRCG